MQDLLIVRNSYPVVYNVAVNVGRILPINLQRLAVIVAMPTESNARVIINSAGSVSLQQNLVDGMQSIWNMATDAIGRTSLSMTYLSHGPIVQGQLSFFSDNANITVTEILMNSDLAALVADEERKMFKRN